MALDAVGGPSIAACGLAFFAEDSLAAGSPGRDVGGSLATGGEGGGADRGAATERAGDAAGALIGATGGRVAVTGSPTPDDRSGTAEGSDGGGDVVAGEPLTEGARSSAAGFAAGVGPGPAGDSAGEAAGGAAPPKDGAGGTAGGAPASVALGAARESLLPAGVGEVGDPVPLVPIGCAAGPASLVAQVSGDRSGGRAASEAPGRTSLTSPRTSRGIRSLFAV